ncbi:MAG: hypothetical protein R3D66_02415 [Alphaproteobacteria bacterium]
MTELLHDSHIWLLASFGVFLAIAWKVGKPAVLQQLDTRIAAIRDEISRAENLRVEAQELLAQYQRKHRDALQESERIIETARQHAQEIRTKAEADLEETMTRREAQLSERLKRMEQNAIDDIQAYAADLAIKATGEIIAGKLDKKANEKLVDQAIKDIGVNIH